MTRYLSIIAAGSVIGALAGGLAFAQEGPRGGGFGHGRIDFAAIDADDDGSLSRAELTTRAAARIAVVDVDGDGQITRAEIIETAPPRNGMRHVFSADPGEAMADRIIAAHGGTAAGAVPATALSEAQVNMLLTRLDTDRDDALSAAEAEAMAEGPRRGQGRHGGRDGGARR